MQTAGNTTKNLQVDAAYLSAVKTGSFTRRKVKSMDFYYQFFVLEGELKIKKEKEKEFEAIRKWVCTSEREPLTVIYFQDEWPDGIEDLVREIFRPLAAIAESGKLEVIVINEDHDKVLYTITPGKLTVAKRIVTWEKGKVI